MKMIYRTVIVMMALAVLAMAASVLRAAEGHCVRCGCGDCGKICRLVCEEKELKVNCWDSKCEEICVPGPCKLGCQHSAPACVDCGAAADGTCGAPCDAGARSARKFVWRDTIPGCARIFVQKKLLKKVETKKVKTYKWVLEDLCGECRKDSSSAAVPPGTALPPVPPEATAGPVTLLPVPAVAISATSDRRLTDAPDLTARQRLSDGVE